MLNFVSNFSNRNDGKFNDDFLIGLRRNDSMVSHLDEACKAITDLLPDNIKYLGYYFNSDRTKILELNQGKDDKDSPSSKKTTTIHINDTYAKEAIFEFDCTYNGQSVKNRMSIWIPMLIDNSHFFIRGNRYSAPIQIIDAITFRKRNVLILKMMTRAVKFERVKRTLTDICGNKHVTNCITVYASSNSNSRISILMYYFANFGFFRTLEYFGVADLISIYSDSADNKIPSNKILFKFGSVFLGVDRDAFLNTSNIGLRSFVASILFVSKRNINIDFIVNVSKWIIYLGETINIHDSFKKGEQLLKTFIISLDYRTIRIINQLIPGKDRTNIFEVGRWLFTNYSKLCAKTDGLHMKRIRLSEYIISPFIKRFIDNIYRFINTTNKNKDIETLNNAFKIKPNIIIHSIIGKISTSEISLNIAQYSSATNDNALFGSMLNWTKGGPESPIAKTKIIGMGHRQIYPDSMGILDLIGGTSANEPGIGGHVSPQAPVDIEKMVFIVDPGLIKK